MKTFAFNKYGSDLTTRILGEKVRKELLCEISKSSTEKIALDFEGVDIVTNSFADECLAKLLYSMPLNELKAKTTFINVTDSVRRFIAFAFQRRYNFIEKEKCELAE